MLLLMKRLLAVSGAIVAVALSLCAHAQANAPAPPACTGTRWILNEGALQALTTAFGVDRIRAVFGSPCTFAVGKNAFAQFRDWQMTRTVSVADARNVASAAHDVSAVIYDPESWQFTPADQQHDPVAGVRVAADAAHANGAILIATPAVDLMRVLAPGAHGDRYGAFLRTGIVEGAARYADVLEIQAQGSETNVAQYRSFVAAAAQQARSANPHVVILAGLSTNPTGHHVSSTQLLQAAQSVRGIVDGFWLNVPAGGAYCPTCGTPQPQVAEGLLSAFAPAAK